MWRLKKNLTIYELKLNLREALTTKAGHTALLAIQNCICPILINSKKEKGVHLASTRNSAYNALFWVLFACNFSKFHTLEMIKTNEGRGTAQSVKLSLCKHKDLS